jgi:hypothetical protein
MKISELLWNLLFGIGAMSFSVTGDDGGGNVDDPDKGAGDKGGKGQGDGDGDGDGEGGEGDGEGEGEGEGNPKSKLSDTEAKLLKETMERKKQLKQISAEKAALEEKLKQFEGIDPVAVRELLREKQERENAEMEKKGQWDALKQQMVEQHKSEKTELMNKLGERESRVAELEAKVAELTIGAAFAQSTFIKDEMALTPNKTRVVYGAHFEFDEENRVVAYDKPKGAANRVLLVDAAGEPLDFDAALRKLVEADPERDQLLRSKVKPGAGSGTSGKTPPKVKTEGLTGRERIAAALAKGGVIN